jgi:hypothetical protein
MAGCDLADLDNDGFLDLGANSFGCCDGVWIYKNNGDGTWSKKAGALDLNSNMQFRFGDFDHDGQPDFIANNTQFDGQAGQVWKNTGNFTFSPMQTGLPLSSPFFKFDIKDVNGDGADDIGITTGGYPSVYTFDTLTQSWIAISNGLPTTNESLQNLAFNDMDADGFIDLVTYKSGLFTIYRGDGAGNWVQAATLTVPETTLYDLKLGDLDQNGYPDIVYWAKFQGSNRLRVYLQSSTFVIPGPVTGPITVCEGSTEQYSVPAAVGATSYTWTLPSGWSGNSTTESIVAEAGSTSGTISVVANSASGSSAPVSLFVNVISIDTTVVQSGNTLTSSMNGSWQWIDCIQGLPVPNAIDQSFTPEISGSYAVVINVNNCIDTSGCHEVLISNRIDLPEHFDVVVTGNQAGDELTIVSRIIIEDIFLINQVGQLIRSFPVMNTQAYLNTAGLSKGLYFLSIQSSSGKIIKKVMIE